MDRGRGGRDGCQQSAHGREPGTGAALGRVFEWADVRGGPGAEVAQEARHLRRRRSAASPHRLVVRYTGRNFCQRSFPRLAAWDAAMKPTFTLGIEEGYQTVDPETRDLRP